MEQRTYHGDLSPDDLANALIAQFNQGNTIAQRFSQAGPEQGRRGDRVIVQIGARDRRRGVENALAVSITKTDDGVDVAVGKQQWIEAATDLVQSGLGALFNPFSVLANLGEIVSDVSSFALPAQIWQTVEGYCKSVGAGLGGSAKQVTIACAYCGVANSPGAPTCIGCGAPLGNLQPIYCPQCGQAAPYDAKSCQRCGTRLAPRG